MERPGTTGIASCWFLLNEYGGHSMAQDEDARKASAGGWIGAGPCQMRTHRLF